MFLNVLRTGIFAALALCVAAPAFAADPPRPVVDTPAKAPTRSTAVSIEHEGTDSIGARLATRLKEQCNTSNLFSLTEKDMPKMYIMVTTKSEFAERPEVGSVYSIIWAFRQQKGQLAFLISREVGTVNDGQIDDLVSHLMERSDGLSVKYEYLWK